MLKRIEQLQYITQGNVPGKDHAGLVREVCEAGVKWVQLRVKDMAYEALLAQAEKVRTVCTEYGVTLIINDNVSIAKAIDADGVHLGKDDMHPAKARQLLGKDKIIGGTANALEDILELYKVGIDYVGLGPFRYTSTKEKLSPLLRFEGYQNIMSELQKRLLNTIPVIAIGGIQADDIEPLLETGVHGVAVASAINKADDIKAAAKLFLSKFENAELNFINH